MKPYDFGILSELMNDDDIVDIIISQPRNISVWNRHEGRQKHTDIQFEDAAALLSFAQGLASSAGQTLDAANPIIEARLADGSSSQLIAPPIATQGAIIHISKPNRHDVTMDSLVEFNGISRPAADFLAGCARGRMNIIVIGGYNSGKTTFLNILLDHVHPKARVAVIQPISALTVNHEDSIILETRRPDIHGTGAITNANLLYTAQQLLPDRLVIAEFDGTEGSELLHLMQLGYEFLWAMNASSPRDALTRFESSATAGNLSMPLLTIREGIAQTVNLIVHLELVEGIWRKRIVGISEIRGMKGDTIDVAPLFIRQHEQDKLVATGEMPLFLQTLRDRSIEVDENWFQE